MTAAQVFSLRKRLGITQNELRRRLNYRDVMTISRWERGVKRVPKRAAERLRALRK